MNSIVVHLCSHIRDLIRQGPTRKNYLLPIFFFTYYHKIFTKYMSRNKTNPVSMRAMPNMNLSGIIFGGFSWGFYLKFNLFSDEKSLVRKIYFNIYMYKLPVDICCNIKFLAVLNFSSTLIYSCKIKLFFL